MSLLLSVEGDGVSFVFGEVFRLIRLSVGSGIFTAGVSVRSDSLDR